MVFTTQIFLFYFLPLTLLAYYLLPRLAGALGASADGVGRLRNLLLLGLSYVFYGWWNPWFLFLIAFITGVNYLCGWVISRPGIGARRRLAAVTVATIASLGTLGFFKYFVFVQVNLNHALAWLGADGIRVLHVALPVGISFYTFQALSYTVDVYRGVAPPARSFSDVACYIALFPQLVAGPIVRYNTVAGQIVARAHRLDRFASGVALFVLGFGKKLLLANPMGEVADAAFGAESLTALDAWWGAAAYAFQIYFDFSGYSDMAIGLGRMVGFEFPRNFDAPYRSESITEFWRRWHISLSTFLRDYLYIPLGGNRRGWRRTYRNLGIVMLLGGLWHGASWTFVAWGAYHGALLVLERTLGKRSPYRSLPRPARVAVTFVLVLFSWVLFRSATISDAMRYLAALFGAGAGAGDPASSLLSALLYSPGKLILMSICAALALSPTQAHEWSERIGWPKAGLLALTFAASVAAMVSQAFNPFLYFQF